MSASSLNLDYLGAGLVVGKGLAPAVSEATPGIARQLHALGVEPAVVELTSELLARTAARLASDGSETLGAALLLAEVSFLAPPEALRTLLAKAAARPLGRVDLAALAVHLLDLAEQMAMELYIPELPALLARSDRSGDAARRVGAARHLRG